MADSVGGEVFEQRPEGHECRQGHLRGLHEGESSTALTRGHPLGDDGPRAVRQHGEENPLSSEGDDLLTVYRERVAIQRMPWIVDGNRR